MHSYVVAIQEHVDEITEDLDTIYDLLQSRTWTRIERKGAERLLQTLIESCIGVAKHLLKKQQKTVPSDVYSVFVKLTEMQLIEPQERQNWKQIIGMRNAIVHDYLNLDEAVIRSVIEDKLYLKLRQFVFAMGELLLE